MAIIGGKKKSYQQITPEEFQKDNDLRFGTIITNPESHLPYKHYVSWGENGIAVNAENSKIRIVQSGIYRRYWDKDAPRKDGGKGKYLYGPYTANTPVYQECFRSLILIRHSIDQLTPMICDFYGPLLNVVNWWEDNNCDEDGTFITFSLREVKTNKSTKIFPENFQKIKMEYQLGEREKLETQAMFKWLKKSIADLEDCPF